MRLIDADALVQYLTSRKCECVDDVGKSWNYGIDTAIRVVDQCITIDSEPVRHGHWIIHVDELFPADSTQECSVCHGEEWLGIKHESYCPNCGAKLDEVSE